MAQREAMATDTATVTIPQMLPSRIIVTRHGGRGHLPHSSDPASLAGFSRTACFPLTCPALHSATRSVFFPRPSARRGSAFSAFRKPLCSERKRFPEPSENAPLGTGERAPSRRFAQECPERKAGQIQTRSKTMKLFENTVRLRGYLSSDPVVPSPDASVKGGVKPGQWGGVKVGQ